MEGWTPQTDSVDEKIYFKSAGIQYYIQHSIQYSILYYKSAEKIIINQQRYTYYIFEVSRIFSVFFIVRCICDDLKWSVLGV